MSRHFYLITAMLASAPACSSDKPKPGDGDEGSAEPAAEAAKVVALPPLTPLGKPAAELEGEGWTAVEIPPELAARLRDSAPVEPEVVSPALRRELRALAQSDKAPSFDSGFADTVRLIEGAVTRMAAERRREREAELVESLQRLMGPRDPDLDAVPAESPRSRPALQAPAHGDVPVHLASSREGVGSPSTAAQESQTRAVQLAPGVQGTETTSSDGSSTTTEIGFKKGGSESVTKSSTTSPEEYQKNGEVGVKHDISSTKRSKAEGGSNEEITRAGWEERLGFCPDAGGIVRGRYTRTIQSSQVLTVGDVTINHSTDLQGEFTLTVSVDDDARAQEALVEGTSILKIAVGARGGGNARPMLKELRADARWQHSVHDPLTYKDGKPTLQGGMHYRLSSADEADRRFDQALLENLGHAMAAATSLAKQAEERWRNGACVEVTPHPEEKSLRLGAKTTFRIEVKHKRDGGPFPYPVRMMAKKEYAYIDQTLGKLDPQGTLTAPASFQYTAPAKGTPEAQTWRGHPGIDRGYPMSISRRGIGLRSFYVRYDSLRRTFRVTYQYLRETEKNGVAQNVTYRAVLRELDQPDDNGDTFAGMGDYNLVARLWKANCASYGSDEMEVINGGGSVRAKGSISSEDPQSISLIFQLQPLTGPRMRLFTRSFAGLEQQLRKQTASGNQDDIPFMASRAVGLVNIRGKAGDTTRVVVTGETECEGEMTTRTVARVKRLR